MQQAVELAIEKDESATISQLEANIEELKMLIPIMPDERWMVGQRQDSLNLPADRFLKDIVGGPFVFLKMS